MRSQHRRISRCVGADSDSYTPLQGDLNDAEPAIYPNATETPDGVDDDCNGVVDDEVVKESSDFPNAYCLARKWLVVVESAEHPDRPDVYTISDWPGFYLFWTASLIWLFPAAQAKDKDCRIME